MNRGEDLRFALEVAADALFVQFAAGDITQDPCPSLRAYRQPRPLLHSDPVNQEDALAEILVLWLQQPDSQRTEVKMFGFAFDAAADPRYRLIIPKLDLYPVIRDYLYQHGSLRRSPQSEPPIVKKRAAGE